MLEKEKLNEANFIDWYRNLRIVLRNEKKEYVLEQPYPDDLPDGTNAAAHREWDVCGSRWNLPLLDNGRDISGPLNAVGLRKCMSMPK